MKRVEIAVVAGDDLRLFSSIDAAERNVEATDIRAGAPPLAFDRDGKPYRFAIHDNGWGIETVRLVAAADEAPRPELLRAHLERRLARDGIVVRPSQSLAALLDRAAIFIRR